MLASLIAMMGGLAGCQAQPGSPDRAGGLEIELRDVLRKAVTDAARPPTRGRYRRSGHVSVEHWLPIGCVNPQRLLPGPAWIESGTLPGGTYVAAHGPAEVPDPAAGDAVRACWVIEQIRDATAFRSELETVIRAGMAAPELRAQAIRTWSSIGTTMESSFLLGHLDHEDLGFESMRALSRIPRIAFQLLRDRGLPSGRAGRARALWIFHENAARLRPGDLDLVVAELQGPCQAEALAVLVRAHATHPRSVDARALELIEDRSTTFVGCALAVLTQTRDLRIRTQIDAVARGESTPARELALQYQGMTADGEERRVLAGIAQDSAEPAAVRSAALFGLVSSGDPEGLASATSLRLLDEPATRIPALTALSMLGESGPAIVSRVQALLEDPDVVAQELAADILSRNREARR